MGFAGLPCGSSAIQKQLCIEPNKGNLRVCIHIRAPWASAQPGPTIKEIGRFEMLGVHAMCLSMFAWTYIAMQRDMNIHNFVTSTCLYVSLSVSVCFSSISSYPYLSLSILIYHSLSLSVPSLSIPANVDLCFYRYPIWASIHLYF